MEITILWVAMLISRCVMVSCSSNRRDIVNNLLKTYDRKIIPLKYGEPLNVSVGLYISDMVPVEEAPHTFSFQMYFRYEWIDYRLAYGEILRQNNESAKRDEYLIYQADFGDLIWKPDMYFPKGLEVKVYDFNKRNQLNLLYANGTVYHSERTSVYARCRMEMTRYPFDKQHCVFPIESVTYDRNSIRLQWADGTGTIQSPLMITDDYINKQYGFDMHIIDVKIEKTEQTGMKGAHDTLNIGFDLSRNIYYYLIQMYLPIILIVFLSWTGFWIDYKSTKARVSLCVTTLLTVTVLGIKIKQLSTGANAMDGYVLLCFFYAFAALMEFSIVGITNLKWVRKASRNKKAASKDEPLNEFNNQNQEEKRESTRKMALSPRPLRKSNLIKSASPRIQELDEQFEGNDTVESLVYEPVSYSERGDTARSENNFHVHEIQLEHLKAIYDKRNGNKGFIPTKTVSKKLYEKHKEDSEVHFIDKISRYVFPISFFVLNAIYFGFVMN